METFSPNDIDHAINLLQRARDGETIAPSTLRLARRVLKEWSSHLHTLAAHKPESNVAKIVTRMAKHYTELSNW